MLLALLSTGTLPAGTVTEEDFSDDMLRAAFIQLSNGKTPAMLIQDAQDEQTRKLYSEVFLQLNDDDHREALIVAQECLRKLRITRFQTRIDAKKASMRQMPDSQSRANALIEIAELSKELLRLKQQESER